MKNLITTFALFLILLIPFQSFSQSDCNPYFLLKEGKKWTTENYNARDKYRGKQTYEVKAVNESGGAITAKVHTISYDKKDKVQMDKEIEFTCKDGAIEMDMSQYMPNDMMESFKDMDVETEFDAVTIPEKMEVGQYLDEGGVSVTISGPMTINMDIRIQDRKVIAQESIEVPAGKYETYKINSIIKMDAMVSRETKNIQWIAKGVGVVRSELYDKKGKLNSYTVLSEIN